MSIKSKLKKLYQSYKHKKREKEVLDVCGCICWCPKCNDILNDQADSFDDVKNMKVYYHCNTCGHNSIWTFDAAPAPILLSKL